MVFPGTRVGRVVRGSRLTAVRERGLFCGNPAVRAAERTVRTRPKFVLHCQRT